MPRGLVIAAPASGSGKTVLTLAILRAMHLRGLSVAGAKSGPDYIDPQFHALACEGPSVNLDAWAMDQTTLRARAGACGADVLIVEGAMGVLDGAGLAGRGSAADLSETLGLPVVLVVDATKQAHSAPLTVAGLQVLRPDVQIAGVILNRTRSKRHADMAGAAVQAAGFKVFGAVPQSVELALPERHLGLVQAQELSGITPFLDSAARIVSEAVDLDALLEATRPVTTADNPVRLPPLGQRIAIAHDDAFAFLYPHLLDDWHAQGAEISLFSPLANDGSASDADAIFLPGGYPELHAGRLAAAMRFQQGMRDAAERALIYGECGGYMVLGESLEDAQGDTHAMLGLLPLQTSFHNRRLSLGFRTIADQSGLLWSGTLAAHEFHYCTTLREGDADRLYSASDADGRILSPMGLRVGRTCGSFAHVIGPMPSV